MKRRVKFMEFSDREGWLFVAVFFVLAVAELLQGNRWMVLPLMAGTLIIGYILGSRNFEKIDAVIDALLGNKGEAECEAVLTINILRYWSAERRKRFAEHLLGDKPTVEAR